MESIPHYLDSLFGMAVLTTDLHPDLKGARVGRLLLFLGRPKQNRPESQRYCAVEVTAICCKGKRRAACQFDGVPDWDRNDNDM